MSSKKKYPFNITCRVCGSNDIDVIAFEYRDLELKCLSCGTYCDCGRYRRGVDYSNMTYIGSKCDDDDEW